MKITRRQLKRIITEATKLVEYGESGSWGSPMNDYEQGYQDGLDGYQYQGVTSEYESGYEDGKRDSDLPSMNRDQNSYDDAVMDVGYYHS
tara:strand:+ start:597 stop:866 length:270 start_codon:yes stop_codon:yes gene_type:complete